MCPPVFTCAAAGFDVGANGGLSQEGQALIERCGLLPWLCSCSWSTLFLGPGLVSLVPRLLF